MIIFLHHLKSRLSNCSLYFFIYELISELSEGLTRVNWVYDFLNVEMYGVTSNLESNYDLWWVNLWVKYWSKCCVRNKEWERLPGMRSGRWNLDLEATKIAARKQREVEGRERERESDERQMAWEWGKRDTLRRWGDERVKFGTNKN